MYKRPVEHFLKTELYNKIEKFTKMNPEAFIYKDMEEIEEICNKILDNGEVDVVHSPSPIQPPSKVHSLKVEYETNEMGFVIPETCKFRLYF